MSEKRPVESESPIQGAQVLSTDGEAEFHRLLDALPAAAYTCDPDGLITYFNRHAVEVWGRAPKVRDPEDRFCGSFKLFSPDGEPIRHDQCWMALAIQENKEYNGREIVIERPDGSRRTALAHANPIRDPSHRLAGAVNVLVDISERKQIEMLLRDADRSKDEFLATLAHELRNPLAPLRNAVQILHMQATPSDETRWALEVIERQMQHMTRLIDDLLDISRITRNRLELHLERVDVRTIVREAVETSRPLIEAAGHDLSVLLPDVPLFVDADTTRLAQAVSNLLNNAAKYTPPGGRIWLEVDAQGDQVHVTVRDTGIGIPPEMLPRVFDIFTQVDQSLERSQGGLGVGLALVRRLVEMHGGGIDANSDGAGKGSQFAIRLPLPPEEIPAAGTTHREHRPRRASRLRILVVDDNRDSSATLEVLLKKMGNEIRVAHDGVEALGVASEFRPDVVLLDIGLPKLNGYDAARKIREQTWGWQPVLVALTGWGQDADKHRAKEAGFDHHLVKPVNPLVLMDLIASLEKPGGGKS